METKSGECLKPHRIRNTPGSGRMSTLITMKIFVCGFNKTEPLLTPPILFSVGCEQDLKTELSAEKKPLWLSRHKVRTYPPSFFGSGDGPNQMFIKSTREVVRAYGLGRNCDPHSRRHGKRLIICGGGQQSKCWLMMNIFNSIYMN